MNAQIEQLKQLATVTWDGNLICSHERDALVKSGLVLRVAGWNLLSAKGVEYLIDLNLIKI
jgi:hypothetical protein